MNLHTLHRASACFVALFAVIHIVNHLTAVSSIQTHMRFMDIARSGYRQPLVEAVLLLCVIIQGLSGLWFVAAGWKQRHGWVAWLQAASGGYLALFLLIHVGAVMYGRSLGLDTNFYFAAAGFYVPPLQYFFVPYYFLAVVALFTHLSCAAYWYMQSQGRSPSLVVAPPMLLGAFVSSLIVLVLAGEIQPFEVPAEYKNTYSRVFSGWVVEGSRHLNGTPSRNRPDRSGLSPSHPG